MRSSTIGKTIALNFVLFAMLNCSGQNPGNIGTTALSAWFKPDALPLGSLSNWTTTFPTGGSAISLNDVTTPFPIVVNTPAAYTSNYNRTIDFNGNASGTDKVLENNTVLNLLNNNSAGGTGTMLCAYYVPTGATGHMVMYREGSAGSVDGIQFRNLGGICRLALGTTDSPNGSRDYTETRKPDLVSYHGNKSGAGTMVLYQKSRLITGGVSSSTTGDVGLYFGGRKSGTFNGHFTGFLSEVIFYNQNLTASEYEKVNSYLAIKYGITLSNFGGGISGDYRSTTGALLWDADFSAAYHNNIIGIGRDDNEALLQKQSHNFDDTARIYVSTLQTNNDANTGAFTNDNSYVLIGDNTGIMCESSTTNLEMPYCGLYSRIVREWKVSKSNFAQNFNADFTVGNCTSPATINAADIQLLVDDDGDFSSGATQSYYNGDGTGVVITYSNPVISVSNISATHLPNDSTKFITLIIRPIFTPMSVNACASYTSPSGRYTWSTSGIYGDTLSAVSGCDSALRITLNITPTLYDTIRQTICSNQFYSFNSRNLNLSGSYADTFVSAGFCDSFVTLLLNVNAVSAGTINATICSNQSYLFNAVSLNTSGTYLDTFINSTACDSVVTLNLTVNAISASTINSIICSNQSYLFNGVSRSRSGTFLDTFSNSRGCDSVVTLNLTVNSTSAGILNVAICSNQSYVFNGINRTLSGSYLDTVANSVGCDSVITLNLTVNPTSAGTIATTICSNQSYLFNGVNRNTTGSFIDTLVNYIGCDSVITLNLTVNPTSNGTINQSICNGSSYFFNGLNLNSSGSYLDTLISYISCDSVLTLNLNVLTVPNTTINQNICNGFTYLFNGLNIAATGTYRDTFASIIGCDSIVILNLFVSPRLSGTITANICSNQSYFFNSQNYSTSGTYNDTIASLLGCDSFVTLNLTVHSVSLISINDSICTGASLFFNGQTITTPGIYFDTLNTIYGCDSVIQLSLFIYPSTNVIINSGNDTTIFIGATVNLVASGTSSTLWNNSSNSNTIIVSPTVTTSYTVIGTDSNLCSSADTIEVFVIELRDTSAIALPSAFTPNGDGLNDIFRILKTYNIKIVEFLVFNRWGEQVFRFDSTIEGWDGTFRGRQQPQGSYVYYVKGQSLISNDVRSYTGTVTLLR